MRDMEGRNRGAAAHHKDGRGSILAAATRLFSEKGFEGASMRLVAKAAKMTPAALYHHFANKDALYDAVVSEMLASTVEPLRLLTRADKPASDRLHDVLLLIAQLVETFPDGVRLIRRELTASQADPARQSSRLTDAMAAPLEEFFLLIEELAPGEDPVLVVGAIGSLLLGAYELRPILGSLPTRDTTAPTPEQTASLVHTLFMRGFGLDTANTPITAPGNKLA
ncbi:MAG: helix-turn-helix domain-containing protein [Alphaproteobacteria bacterium]